MPTPAKATSKSASKKPTKAQQAKAIALFGADAMESEHKITEEQRREERRAEDRQAAELRRANPGMAFALQQLSAPVAPQLTTPPVVNQEFEAARAALEAKFGIKVAPVTAKSAKAPAEKISNNGVTRPNSATLCGKIWAAADQISKEVDGVCPISLLKEHKDVKGTNEHTIKTQYARWRQFNGVSGRLPKVYAVHQTQGEYAGMPEVK